MNHAHHDPAGARAGPPVPRPTRAPALYVTGRFTEWADGLSGRGGAAPGAGSGPAMETPETRVTLRLPVPPTWDGPVEGVAAAARRAHRAYVSALDAMHHGRDGAGQAAAQAGKLERFVADLRRDSARVPLLHLVRIWRTVERASGAAPLLRSPPPTPATAALLHVPPPTGWRGGQSATLEALLEARYAWPLEWLRTRGYLTPRRDLRLEWRLLGPA